MWLLRFSAQPNNFLHFEQVWHFTPLWMSICLFRWSARPNDLLHWPQLRAPSLLWVTMTLQIFCLAKWLLAFRTNVYLVSTVVGRTPCHPDLILGWLFAGKFSTLAFDELKDLKLSLQKAHIFKTLIRFKEYCHFHLKDLTENDLFIYTQSFVCGSTYVLFMKLFFLSSFAAI